MLRSLTRNLSHDELFACTRAATGYVRQARAHSGPPKNISSSVEVAIHRQSAMRTIVPSLTECLLHCRAATGTFLAGVSSIHLDNSHTGPFSLVAKHREEFGPRSVMHMPRKRTARQRVHIERLDRNHVVVAHETRACLMQKRRPRPRRCSVTASSLYSCLAPIFRIALLSGERPLRNSQPALRAPRGSDARNEASVGQGGKGAYAKIHPDSSITTPRCRSGNVEREADLPSLRVADEGTGTNRQTRRHGPVDVNLEPSWHSFEAKAGAVERNSGKLAKAEAAPPADPAEARKTSLAPVFFEPSEESPVGVVQAFQRRALEVRWNGCGLRVGLPPLSKASRLIDIRERHTVPMGADPLFQRCVVELPLRFEQLVEYPVLFACRNHTVLVCENHVFETIRSLAHSVSHAEMP